jgi:hypothetical protein
MSSESVGPVARSWVDVGRLHARFVLRFMIFIESVRNILDSFSYLIWESETFMALNVFRLYRTRNSYR